MPWVFCDWKILYIKSRKEFFLILQKINAEEILDWNSWILCSLEIIFFFRHKTTRIYSPFARGPSGQKSRKKVSWGHVPLRFYEGPFLLLWALMVADTAWLGPHAPAVSWWGSIFTWPSPCVSVSLLIRHLMWDSRPSLLQYDLILTTNTAKALFPNKVAFFFICFCFVFNWGIVAYNVGFVSAVQQKWVSHTCTYIPSLRNHF